MTSVGDIFSTGSLAVDESTAWLPVGEALQLIGCRDGGYLTAYFSDDGTTVVGSSAVEPNSPVWLPANFVKFTSRSGTLTYSARVTVAVRKTA
jgi:hypothetical protein